VYSQTFKKEFIDSFRKSKKEELISFGRLINWDNQMTKQEALDYVYNGDTSRLYCIQKIFNMETEKTEGVSRDIYLPNKSLRIDGENYILIATTSFECQNINEMVKVKLTLSLIDNNYNLKDTMLVYEGNDYDYKISGLLNTSNGKAFITGYEKETGRYAKLIKINLEILKFEVVREKIHADISSENWEKELEKLGWYEEFISQ
jgi:hypothetical protein